MIAGFGLSRASAGRATMLALLAATAIEIAPLLAGKAPEPVPWTVRVDVHWGAKKNREAYRSGFQRALAARLVEKTCFSQVVETGTADLVLDVQLNDFLTEQEYESSEAMLPGQGEEHRLRAARVSVNLDYRLHPEGKENVAVLGGHIFRQLQREAQAPADPAEERVLRDLTADAARWIVREVCERRGRLASKLSGALGAPASPARRPEGSPNSGSGSREDGATRP